MLIVSSHRGEIVRIVSFGGLTEVHLKSGERTGALAVGASDGSKFFNDIPFEILKSILC